jgi:hypothetical protein
MSDLIARIEAAADALTDRVLAEMYEDPFWNARYGERAQTHGRQDGLFHIKYLREAIRANDPSVIEHYARWLQQLLTTRGMCTRHLDENFERLARAIGDTIPDSAPAVAMLAAARAALRYPDGPARRLQDATARLAAGDHDLLTDYAYAADSLALNQPAVFANHVAWTADFVERRGGSRAQFDARIATLRETVKRELGIVV